MAEITTNADERLSAQVSEVIHKCDMLTDKINIDVMAKFDEAITLANSAAESEASANRSASQAADSATQARESLELFQEKLASGEYIGEKGEKGDQGEKGDKG
ncbi:MAG: hypothetical protein IJD28_07835, partial [Deferribacterales bacterium]|nr:hypothetical protein [Deferribacterales bacterium]